MVCGGAVRTRFPDSRRRRTIGPSDRPADRSAELVALQRIVSRREEIPRVDVAVAQKLEQAAVELIGARLVTTFIVPPRMEPVAGRESAGLHTEFLDRVGKGERQVDVGVVVVVVAAVHHEIGAVGLAAGDGDGGGTGDIGAAVCFRADDVAHARRSRTRRRAAPARWPAALEGQFQHALIVDDLETEVSCASTIGALAVT